MASKEKKTIFFLVGEASGDVHAAQLITSLKALNPQLEFEGLAGPAMRAEGIQPFVPMEDFQVMGFSDVLRSLPRLWKLFLGSRESEIRHNLPIQLQAAHELCQTTPLQIAISLASPKLRCSIAKEVARLGLELGRQVHLIPQEQRYELMQRSSLALATSGTVTLELALHYTPTVVCYKLTRLNWLIAACILRLRLPHYCLVNILPKKRSSQNLCNAR